MKRAVRLPNSQPQAVSIRECKFSRTMHWSGIFRLLVFGKQFETCPKCLKYSISDILFLMPPNFIIPLDINDFLFVRYIFQFCCKVIYTFFHEKRVECASLYNLSHRIEYDSNSLRDICSSVAVLRQSLMRHEHPQYSQMLLGGKHVAHACRE